MKKIKLLLITLFIFLFGLNNVNAMTLKPSGDTSGKRGSEVTLYITLNRTSEEKTISAVDGTFSYDADVLTLTKSESLMGSNWTMFSDVTNNGTFSYANLTFNTLITDTNKNIVKLTFKVNDNAAYGNTTIKVSNPMATDEVGNGVSISGGSHTLKVLSDVNTLSNLSIEGNSINFNENTTTYDLEIDDTSITISATKKDANSTLSGDTGTKTLKYGKNSFQITVTSESGIKKTYTINVTRPDHRNKVNTLSSLKISAGDLKFNKDTLTYNIDVENEITSIKVEASLTDSKSSFVSGYGPRTIDLKEGKNVIEVKVKAENESIKTYTINVNRKSNKSNNNYISELILSEGTIEFDKEVLEYNITVLYDVEKIDLDITTEHEKATYEIDAPEELIVGENIITIKVTAEDESIREYKIIVTKKEDNETISSNSKLKSLTIKGYTLNFSSNIYEYNLKIKDETSLIISYTPEDSNSNVTIVGNENLQENSVIEISVLAEDGTQTIYKINITKGNNNILFIVLPIIALLIIVIIIIVLKKKKNQDNNHNNDTSNNNMEELAIKQNVQYTQNQSVNHMQNQNTMNTQTTQAYQYQNYNQNVTMQNNVPNNNQYPNNTM